MSYRPARRADFAVGLAATNDLVDYWGELAWHANEVVPNLVHEEALLSRALWVWEGAGEPTGPPADTERPSSARLLAELEMESLRKLAIDGGALPANFLGLIWRRAQIIFEINTISPWHPLALLAPGSQPSNALRNAYSTALLADRMGSRLGLSQTQRHCAAAAALTMNWGILQLQDRLSASRGGPTSQDMQSIKDHPRAAAALLRERGLDNPDWLAAVEQHHEEPDGRGYPNRLLENATTRGAQILRACDRYIALTASRRFRFGGKVSDAKERARFLIPETGGLRAALLAELGEHPPGGFWTDPNNGHIHICLGRDPSGIERAVSLSSMDSALPRPLAGLFEDSPRELSVPEHRTAVERLDALSWLNEASYTPRQLHRQ